MFRPPVQSVSLRNLIVIFMLCVFTSQALAVEEKNKMIGVVAFKTGEVKISRDMAQFMPAALGEQIFLEDKIQTAEDGRLQILLKDETTFTLGPNAELIIDKFVYDPDESNVEVSIKSGAFRFISGATSSSGPDAVKLKLPKATLSIRGTEVIGDISPVSTQIILMSGIINVITDNDIKEISQHGWGVEVDENGDISEPSPVADITLENVIILLESKQENEDEDEAEDQLVANTQTSSEEESEESQEEADNDSPETTSNADQNNDADNESGDENINTAQNDGTNPDAEPAEPATAPQPLATSNAAPLDVNGNLDGDGQLKTEDDQTSEFDQIILASFQQDDKSETGPLNTDITPENNLQTENDELELTPEGEIKLPSSDPANTPPPADDQSNIINQLTSPVETEAETEKLATEKTSEDDMKLVVIEATNNPNNSPNNPNNAPIAEAIEDLTLEDTSTDDTFTNITTKINANDPDGDELIFSIVNGLSDTSQAGYDSSITGTYGTLYLNTNTGDLLFIPNDSAIEGLTADATEEFNLNISDGSNQITQILKAFFTGTDDSLSSSNIALSILDTTSIAENGFINIDGNLSGVDLDTDAREFSIIVDGSVVTGVDTPENFYGPIPSSNDPNYDFITNIYANYDKAYDLGNSAYATDIVLNSQTGAFKIIPNSILIDALDDGETASEQVSFQVSNGIETVTRTLDINFQGAEDPPVIQSILENPMTLTSSQIDIAVAGVDDRDVETITDLTSNLPTWIGFAQDPANPSSYLWSIYNNANNDPIVEHYLNGSIVINFQGKSGDQTTDILSKTLTFACQSPKCDNFIHSTDTITPVPTNSTTLDLLDTPSGKIDINGVMYYTLTDAEMTSFFDSSSIGVFKRKYSVASTTPDDGAWDVGHVVMANYSTKDVQSDVYLTFSDLQYAGNTSGNFTHTSTFDWNASRIINDGTFTENSIGVDTGVDTSVGNDFNVDITHHVSFLKNAASQYALAGALEIIPSGLNEVGFNDTSINLMTPRVVVLEPQ